MKGEIDMLVYHFISLWHAIFEFLFADKEKRDFLKNVPNYCRVCELLGICRNQEKHWKCRQGCLMIKYDQNM